MSFLIMWRRYWAMNFAVCLKNGVFGKEPVVVVLLVIFLLLGPSPQDVGAVTLYVPKDYPTIQEAINAAQKKDIIRVAVGRYLGSIIMKENLTLEGGWNEDFSQRNSHLFRTTLDGGNKGGPVVQCAYDTVLDGFTIINGSPSSSVGRGLTLGSGIHCQSSSTSILNNIIKGNKPAGIYCNESSVIIINNLILDNDDAGIYCENNSYLKIKRNVIIRNNNAGIGTGKVPASWIDVRNNVIQNNSRAGIDATSATGFIFNNIVNNNQKAGIMCGLGPIKIINNTVTANAFGGIIEQDPVAGAIIKNNIVTHNGDTGIRAVGKGSFHNLLYSNNMTGNCNPDHLWCVRRQFGGLEDDKSYLERHNIIADPLYMDAKQYDFHLRPGSPAINGGDPDSNYNDFNFGPSQGGELNDMGAYGGPFTIAGYSLENIPPIAFIEGLRTVYLNDRVTLDGSKSQDPNGDRISPQWELVSKPAASNATLAEAKTMLASFNADAPGEYLVKLTVTDVFGLEGEVEVISIMAFDNHPPVAEISAMIADIGPGEQVTLFGSFSSDFDGDSLSYHWLLSFRPQTSKASLVGEETSSPTFVADIPGCYTIDLTVSDGKEESLPTSRHICTTNRAEERKRHVPGQYPTIQTAIDSAYPGDDILIQKGVYRENIIVDKYVNLIGIDWPVIDGGSKEDNSETIRISYVGELKAVVTGLVVTGGGRGLFGHGIMVWKSSPEIFNNKITLNGRVGIGIHGENELTGKASIHDNDIFYNLIGIGNGLEGSGHIYNNRIYSNTIIGIGSRTISYLMIDGNQIYANHIGIGARDRASPHIVGNHIHDNVSGIAISPLTGGEPQADEAMIIKRNFIIKNRQNGLFVSSLNFREVHIFDNTIESNNYQYGKFGRGGGIVFGYPSAPIFSSKIVNNIIRNNRVNDIKMLRDVSVGRRAEKK